MECTEISKETSGYLYKAHAGLRKSKLDVKLIALAELRVSQLNGCAYCYSFHANELREMGIQPSVINRLPGWILSNVFTSKQKIVLRLTEALTHLRDELQILHKELETHFSEKEIVDLTASISLMNMLNRLRITSGDND